MIIAEKSLLGAGIYSPHEAARYVRASPKRFRRWIYGDKSNDAVFDPDIPRDDLSHDIVTFLDFAQALSVQDIRLNVGIPLQRIRQAYKTAQQDYKIEHPFAVKHGIFVFGNLDDPKHCELGIYPGEQSADRDFLAEKCYQITGKKKGNQLISEIVQNFSRNLAYSTRGLADEYCAFEKFDCRILMQPDCRFGKPFIEGVFYVAETLGDAVKNEGGVKQVSDLYEVPVNAVKAAVAYMRELETPPKNIKPKKLSA